MRSVFVRLFLFASIVKLAQSDTNGFVTCDLDLKENAIARLPNECKNLDDPTREALLKEAQSFERFNAKLMEYERSFNADTEDTVYKAWEFRAELYENAELHLCQNTTEVLQDYLECMMEKRTLMIHEIDEKIASRHT